jgi:hypothetical protein
MSTSVVEAAEDTVRRRSTRGVGLASIVAVLAVGLGARIGLVPLGDNSFLTHLATGRLILAEGAVPSSDPYSFTATGAPWVVQSWFASVVYGIAEELGGLRGVQVVIGVLSAVLAALLWRLTGDRDPAGSALLGRLALFLPAVVVGAGAWGSRPYLFGLVFLALAAWAALGGGRVRWLVAVGWVWGNTHGGWMLGVLLLGALAVGAWIDARTDAGGAGDPGGVLRERARRDRRVVALVGLGLLASVVGPLGVHALTFGIVTMRDRGAALAEIAEWRAPAFDGIADRAFLVLVVVCVVALVRRPSWRLGLAVASGLPLALVSARNLVVVSVVLVAAAAPAVRSWGSLRSGDPVRRGGAVLALGAAFAVLLVVTPLTAPAADLRAYPVDAVRWLERAGLADGGARIATQDFVGNYLTLRSGRSAAVFVDDRVDMYPSSVSADATTLTRGRDGWDDVLDRHAIDVVLWERDTPLGQILEVSPAWTLVWRDADWAVFLRSPARRS